MGGLESVSAHPQIARRTPVKLLPLVPFVGLLVLWVVGWQITRPSLATLPSAQRVLDTLIGLAQSGELWRNIVASMTRWALALVVAGSTGMVLGVLAGLNRSLGMFFEPLATFFTAMSGIVWIPLAIVWFGIGTSMVVFIIWNSIFFIVFANTLLGVRSVPVVLEDGIRTLGGSRADIIRSVILPGAWAHIMSGLRAGLGFGWRALIAAEVIGATAGLGAMIFHATEFLRSDVIVAGNLVIGTIGLTIDLSILAAIERRTLERWGLVEQGRGLR
jgi:NitT/TauT family transport system permease protein/taurine transport system permease protein